MTPISGPLMLDEPRRDASLAALQCLWWPLKQDFATGTATFGAKFDDPVGLPDHVQVMLDQNNRVPGIHKPVDDAHQQANI